jgi:hypothetical protein
MNTALAMLDDAMAGDMCGDGEVKGSGSDGLMPWPPWGLGAQSAQLAVVNLMAEDAAESGSRKYPHKDRKAGRRATLIGFFREAIRD